VLQKERNIEYLLCVVSILSYLKKGSTKIDKVIYFCIYMKTNNLQLAETYLHKQAHENLKSYVQERLPDQCQKCMNGLTRC
jgi:hypothetical protein